MRPMRLRAPRSLCPFDSENLSSHREGNLRC